MSFAAKKMTLADEKYVYSEQHIPFIRRFGGIRLSESPLTTEKWVVNEDQSIYMLRIRNFEVREHQVRFLLYIDGAFVVYEGDSDARLTMTLTPLFIAPSLQDRVAEIEELILRLLDEGREAVLPFLVGMTLEKVTIVPFAGEQK